MKTKLHALYNRYGHALPLLAYMVVYLLWWKYLEIHVTGSYQIIHMAIDDYIPFCEYFVIPYYLWFLYIPAAVIFFFFTDKTDYYRLVAFLCTGMTIFLLISTFFPNGHHLRFSVMPRNNIFTSWISMLWKSDTPTNLWPSIHVYNSLGALIAIWRAKSLANRRVLRLSALALTVLITLSTMLIKQHSLFDVLTALLLSIFMYLIIYDRKLLTSTGQKGTQLRTD